MTCDMTYLGAGCLIMAILTGIFIAAYSYYETNIDIPPLEKQAKEYNTYVNSVFKYNMSNRLNNLTDAQLIKNGGVCWQWSELYVRLAENDNKLAGNNKVITTLITFDTNPALNQSHEVAIISDGTGYCVLDQRNFFCVEFQRFIVPRKI